MAEHEDEELRMQFAAGETDAMAPAPPNAADSVRKDTTYSPGSDTETQGKQADPLPGSLDDDIDPADVRAVPGTGGPDDVGDVDVDPEDLNLPWRDAAGTPDDNA